MHGVFQGTLSAAQGGKFIHGFVSGAAASLSGDITLNSDLSSAERVLIGAAIGGTASSLTGGKFINGAATGAFVVLFNHLQHDIIKFGLLELYVGQKLSDDEKTFIDLFPAEAWIIYRNSRKAFNVTESIFPGSIQGNNAADAFRHAYWSALNVQDVGFKITMMYAYAHENWIGNPILSKTMDLYNNLIGIQIGSLSNMSLTISVHNALTEGRLLIIENRTLVKSHFP